VKNSQKHQIAHDDAKVRKLKENLKQLLAQPLVAKGISTKYITSGTRPIVDDLIAGTGLSSILCVMNCDLCSFCSAHETMLGLGNISASTDVHSATSKGKNSKKGTKANAK
jgi:hypothetical protein